ncbi:MAG TPA: hypothetical protein VJ438_04845, partial [Candidatus Nanoarchaeia archaeon]|nr:hypothetical protein [Candidatus Nanoarchaeia archaeon]
INLKIVKTVLHFYDILYWGSISLINIFRRVYMLSYPTYSVLRTSTVILIESFSMKLPFYK